MSLQLEGLTVTLRGRPLARLDATVASGTVLAVMGPSGVGKSSLLLGIAGLLGAPFRVTGRVVLGERDVSAEPAERRGIGLMVQDALLFPHMSVLDNVLFAVPRRGRDGRGRARAERRQVALDHLARVHLEAFALRDPETLSGGQRSRVALARTLAAEPLALLLDEPFSALDQALRGEVRADVFGLARAAGLPVVMVSHDPADADAAAGPVVTLR